MKKLILSLLSIITLCAFVAEQKKVTIYMAGDSTMTNQPLSKRVTDSITGKTFDEPFPTRGWGQMLHNFFKSEVTIDNYALSGRSTLSFQTEGVWKKIMDKVQPNDYVVIQFGHNDSNSKPDRHTTPEQYEANLRSFINDVRTKGAIPILCTPVSRRKFENGRVVHTLKRYTEVCRKIAAEDTKLLFVDMELKSEKIIAELGEEGSTKLFTTLEPGVNKNFPNGIKEMTHFNETGATVMAEEFVKGLRELQVKPLTKYLK
jgi:lysophospholipase L1-like esterase